MRIEETLTKERILELYLNEIYLGLQSYGVAAAAQAYFNKPLDELTLSGGGVPRGAAQGARTTIIRSASPKPPRPGGTGCSTAWRTIRAITAAQAAAAKAKPIIPAQFRRPEPDPGRRLVRRGGAAPADRPVRGGCDDAGRADGAHQPRSGAASRRREGAARRADGLRPQAGRLARPGRASRPRRRALRTDWAAALAQHAAAARACWPTGSLAVVLEETDREARVGWLEHPTARPGTPPAAHRRRCLSDLGWARPVRDGRPGRLAPPHGRRRRIPAIS